MAKLSCPHCHTLCRTQGAAGDPVTCRKCKHTFSAAEDTGKRAVRQEADDTDKRISVLSSDEAISSTITDYGSLPKLDAYEVAEQLRDASSSGERAPLPEPSAGESDTIGLHSSLSIFQRHIADRKQDQGTSPVEFEIKGVMDQGSMGTILDVRQICMDRPIAVKMMRPERQKQAGMEAKFMSEALVTGELDHPNIVSVHEFGRALDGSLFYAMKQVRGTCWKNVIHEKNEVDNLGIFLEMCDAIAFAHDRGYIHRDLKPENIMLGDYGEVLVMDWGLAATTRADGKAEAIKPTMSRAGTPAYMAPEMASREKGMIGPWSDIYLLGGILYEIATGLRPHMAKTVKECLAIAADNTISESERKDELVKIALRAMSTAPRERYSSVKDLQKAVRTYQSHMSSLEMSASASKDLKEARRHHSYEIYARSIYGFSEAVRLWGGNTEARVRLTEAQLAYAQCAFERKDFDLALSLAVSAGEPGEKLEQQIRLEQQKHLDREKRTGVLLNAFRVMGILVLVGLPFAFIIISGKTAEAERMQAEAEKALLDAESLKEAGEKSAAKAESAGEAGDSLRTELGERKSELTLIQAKVASLTRQKKTLATTADEKSAESARIHRKAEESQKKAAQFKERYDKALARANANEGKLRPETKDLFTGIVRIRCLARLTGMHPKLSEEIEERVKVTVKYGQVVGLDLGGVALTDLSFLSEFPLRELNIIGLSGVSLRPILAIKSLELLRFDPAKVTSKRDLRNLSERKWLLLSDTTDGKPVSGTEFWKEQNHILK